jgi:hypothetical protein
MSGFERCDVIYDGVRSLWWNGMEWNGSISFGSLIAVDISFASVRRQFAGTLSDSVRIYL